MFQNCTEQQFCAEETCSTFDGGILVLAAAAAAIVYVLNIHALLL